MAVLSLKDFPDDVYKALRMRAIEEDKTLRDLVIEILSKSVVTKRGLSLIDIT